MSINADQFHWSACSPKKQMVYTEDMPNDSMKHQSIVLGILYIFIYVLMGWSLLPNALRPFKIYCDPPNLGITRT